MTTYGVSRETYNRLKLYQQALIEWQEKFNLVSRNSLEDSWNRHFIDSAQMFPLIPEDARTLVDMGSGAGFPGMVLALMMENKTPYLKVTLVESISKKTLYLKHVADLTGCEVEIINQRIENIEHRKFDVVTARAVTALSDLLEYAFPLMKKNSVCLFPKGKSYAEEIKNAAAKWKFEYDAIPSHTSLEGVILVIRNLAKKGR